MDLELRKYKHPEEFEKYLELFNDAFPEVGGGSRERYDWLLHGYPTNGPKSYEYSAYIEDEMVGFYACVPYKYVIGNIETPVGMTCGVMTSSKHRGKGIFTKLGRYATEEMGKSLPFLTGYPIRPAVMPGHLKVGWKIAFELPLYVRVLKSDAFLKSKRLGVGKYILNPFFSLYNTLANIGVKGGYDIMIYDSVHKIQFDNHWNRFINKWYEQVPNHLIKDSNFMHWRYTRPGNNYNFIEISKGDEIVAFAAMRAVEKLGVPTLCIMDFMTLDKSSTNVLNKAICNLSKSLGAEIILTMASKITAAMCNLINNGFIKSNNIFKLIVKNLTNEFSDEQLLSESNWHLMWVDSDDL